MSKKKPRIGLLNKLTPAGVSYPPEIRPLLVLGKPEDDISYDEWADRLRDYVPQLIEMVLDSNLNSRPEKDPAVWAPIHALSILAELAPVEAIEPLLKVLTWEDDWSPPVLTSFFARVGEPAAPFLKQLVLDTSEKMATRRQAIVGLEAIATENAATRDDIVVFLSRYLEAADETVEEEQLITSAVLALAELEAVEAFPVIERMFNEDRVETFVISFDDVKRKLGLQQETPRDEERRQQEVLLPLKCGSCGRERPYRFERVYIDISAGLSKKKNAISKAFYTRESVVCQRCGAVDQLELTGIGHMLVAAIFASAMAGQPNPFPNVRLAPFESTRWEWLPPRQTLARYRAEIAAHPKDIELRLAYADALWIVEEVDAALEQYEQALLVDPTAGDALYSLAEIKGQTGELAEALKIWEQIERDFDQLKFDKKEDRRALRLTVSEAIKNLREGKMPTPLPLPEVDDIHASEPDALVLPEKGPFGKVGRNEPCPCGSGKKHKHCHGRK